MSIISASSEHRRI